MKLSKPHAPSTGSHIIGCSAFRSLTTNSPSFVLGCTNLQRFSCRPPPSSNLTTETLWYSKKTLSSNSAAHLPGRGASSPDAQSGSVASSPVPAHCAWSFAPVDLRPERAIQRDMPLSLSPVVSALLLAMLSEERSPAPHASGTIRERGAGQVFRFC